MALSLVPLTNISEDFGKIEYQLQVQLNAPRLQISECYDLSNPHVSAQFMTYVHQNNITNTVDVFVSTSEIKQLLSEIANKGIKVDPKRGFRFRVGSFEVDRNKEVIEVVRLTIALGNTLNFQSPTSEYEDGTFVEESPSSSNLRSGYQSLCVSEDSDYVIFNSSQIKTCNLIRFPGGDNLAEALEDGEHCESCNQAPATKWCVNCGARFCESCDNESHSANKVVARHRRIPIAEARAEMEFCPFHENIHVEYYCPDCQAPVCIECKMSGSHSKGNAATHPLIPIAQAYREAIQTSESAEDPIITRRKATITAKLADAEDRLKSIASNAESVEEEITRIANVAIEHAKSLAGDKALLVRSVKTELERKLNEINQLTKFIEAHKQTAGPLAFIRAHDRHSMLIGDMETTDDLPGEIDVMADLSVSGAIDVESSNTEQIVVKQNQAGKHKTTSRSERSHDKKEKRTTKERTDRNQNKNNYKSRNYDESEEQSDKNDNTFSEQNQFSYDENESNFTETNENQANDVNEEESFSKSNSRRSPNNNYTEKRNNTSNLSNFNNSNYNNYNSRSPPSKRSSYTTPNITSLLTIAQKKEQKNKAKKMILKFKPFEGSSILTEEDKCRALYLCFPFKAQPQTHLLFSTKRDGRSIAQMHQQIDGIGITAVLIKHVFKGQEYVFGGFAAAKWNSSGEPFGENSSSFLFSISQASFIPYIGRVSDACHLLASKDTLTFGKYDIILANNFDNCTAVLENSYGVGFVPGSTEAETYLAGEPHFSADIVEVWGFFTIEPQ